MLDDEDVTPSDRLRLIALYVLYKDGILPADLEKLLLHSQLPPSDGEVIRNLDSLGGRVVKRLKEKREPPPPIFPRSTTPSPNAEEYALSRFTTAVGDMLEEHVRGTLPKDIFPYMKQEAEDSYPNTQDGTSATSLRSAKPTWAKSRLSSVEPRQRVIVFVAGGATYSEARACYEVSHKTSRDIFLITSHMMTPSLYLRQLGDLSVNRRGLRLPIDAPPPKAPAHLFEKPEPPRPSPSPAAAKPVAGGLPSRPGGGGPPTAAMAAMNVGSGRAHGAQNTAQGSRLQPGKLSKDHEKEKKKKKHHFFSSSKS
jgi:syntaxin-binding protein 1